MLVGDSSVVGEMLDTSELDLDSLKEKNELVANDSKNKDENKEK